MEYIAMAVAMTDEIHLANGTVLPPVAGGAGLFSLAGMRVWSTKAGIVTGVGCDYEAINGDWFKRNAIPAQGMIVKSAHTPYNTVVYAPDGERTETPRFGLSHFHSMLPTPQDLARFSSGTKGVYIFEGTEGKSRFWHEIFQLKTRDTFTILWEISQNAAIPKNLEKIRHIAQQLELFSLNQSEALALFATDSLEYAIQQLLSWNLKAIFLRIGAQGAYVLSNGTAALVASAKGMPVVDVTGGGNSFCGGALVGWCETQNPIQSAAMGNVSAAFCIAQHGPPNHFTKDLTRKANIILQTLVQETAYE